MTRQANAFEVIHLPSAELVESVRDKICSAMFIAVSRAYEDSCSAGSPVNGDDTADLIASVYAAMRAQEIARDQQISSMRR